jgi:hypothetical protein
MIESFPPTGVGGKDLSAGRGYCPSSPPGVNPGKGFFGTGGSVRHGPDASESNSERTQLNLPR